MFDPWMEKIPWRRKWQPTPVFLPGESHGRRSLVGYSPWDRKESDTTEQLQFHFHFQKLLNKSKLKNKNKNKNKNTFLQSCQHPALVVKNQPAYVGGTRDADLIPGLGRSPGGGHDNALQYSCLENPQGQRSLASQVHSLIESVMIEAS